MTREKVINQLNSILEYMEDRIEKETDPMFDREEAKRDAEALKIGIMELEQEPILDKIRAEIEALPKTYPFVNHIDTYVKEDDVKKIIDKYKAKSN